MKRRVLFYSHSGNNRGFAGRIAARLDATLTEIRPLGWRTIFSIIRDMSKDRRPALRPFDTDLSSVDHLILVAPVWDMKVAHPMRTAIERLKPEIGDYSFATLCGYQREGQDLALRQDLTRLVGHPPHCLVEAHVGDLVPEAQRRNVLKISGRRVRGAELDRFRPEIEAFAACLARPHL